MCMRVCKCIFDCVHFYHMWRFVWPPVLSRYRIIHHRVKNKFSFKSQPLPPLPACLAATVLFSISVCLSFQVYYVDGTIQCVYLLRLTFSYSATLVFSLVWWEHSQWRQLLTHQGLRLPFFVFYLFLFFISLVSLFFPVSELLEHFPETLHGFIYNSIFEYITLCDFLSGCSVC